MKFTLVIVFLPSLWSKGDIPVEQTMFRFRQTKKKGAET